MLEGHSRDGLDLGLERDLDFVLFDANGVETRVNVNRRVVCPEPHRWRRQRRHLSLRSFACRRVALSVAFAVADRRLVRRERVRRRSVGFWDTSHANYARIADAVRRHDRRLECRLCRPVERQNTDLTDESVAVADPDVARALSRTRARELQARACLPANRH